MTERAFADVPGIVSARADAGRIEIAFDPDIVSYDKLLALFFDAPGPAGASAKIIARSPEQLAAAIAAVSVLTAVRRFDGAVETAIMNAPTAGASE